MKLTLSLAIVSLLAIPASALHSNIDTIGQPINVAVNNDNLPKDKVEPSPILITGAQSSQSRMLGGQVESLKLEEEPLIKAGSTARGLGIEVQDVKTKNGDGNESKSEARGLAAKVISGMSSKRSNSGKKDSGTGSRSLAQDALKSVFKVVLTGLMTVLKGLKDQPLLKPVYDSLKISSIVDAIQSLTAGLAS